MLAFAPGDTAPAARATPPAARPEARPAPAAPVPAERPTALPPPWNQAANETIPASPAEPIGQVDGEWRHLAESLPGATRQLAMQCERLSHEGNTLRLRLPENQKTLLDNFGDKLKAALAEKLGDGIQVEFEFAAAILQSPATARAREQAARQRGAEEAIQADPFVQTFVRECDAAVTNIRPLAAAG
jgi:DNA polymerase-3 subunit gamma/tau